MTARIKTPKRSTVSGLLALMRVDRPIGTLLLMWPTLWALWIAAEGMPPVDILIIFLIGVFVMRSAGCVINDYFDRNIDGLVSRTQNRPLASGQVKPVHALLLFFGLMLIALVLVLLLNQLSLFVAIGAAMVATSYPLFKRLTYLPQLVLGIAFSASIIMAFAAVTNRLPANAWLLFLSNLLWVIAYDTQYAMVDREEDRTIGLKSTAILFGELDRHIIGLLQISFLSGMYLLGEKLQRGAPYQLGLVAALGVLVYQMWHMRNRDRRNCFNAFSMNRWVGLVIFAGIVADYWLTGATPIG